MSNGRHRQWAAAALVAACGALWLGISASGRESSEVPSSPASLYSNIEAADYVGPKSCSGCHPEQYRAWRANLHRSMNRDAVADPSALIAPFSGQHRYAGGVVSLSQQGDAAYMTLTPPSGPSRRYRVTRTIGSDQLQEYVGREVDARDQFIDEMERRLPFGFVIARRRWLHQQYFDSWFGSEYDDDGAPTINAFSVGSEPWISRCAWCHNTYPLRRRLDRGDIGQGTEQFFEGRGPRRPSDLTTADFVTVGISCESCHLGGREHAVEGEAISFAPRSPRITLRAGAPPLAGGRDNPVLINTVCAQCHSTPSARYPNGSVLRNSSEALDMAAGACMSKIRCVDCHDPHQKQWRHETPCVQCHDGYVASAAAEAHSGHTREEASCLDCHMPRIVQGITGFVRTHRISSPGNAAAAAAGSVNACNLCHVDRSLEWTRTELAKRWQVRIPGLSSGSSWAVTEPAYRYWLEQDSAPLRAVAADALSRSPHASAQVREIIPYLDEPIAYYRLKLLEAVERALGRQLSLEEFDVAAPPQERSAQLERLLGRLAPQHRN